MKKVLSVIILLGISCGFVAGTEPNVKKLSLKDAIFYALKNNLDLQVQKADTEISRLTMRINKTIYLPSLEVGSQYVKSKEPSSSLYDGVESVEDETFSWSLGLTQTLPLGGNLSVTFANQRNETNTLDAVVNPVIFTSGRIDFTQPLLRNFGALVTNYQIRLAANNYKISKYQLEQNIVNLVYNVESAYWELVYAHQNLETRKMALERAKDLLKQNEVKVKVGTLAPIEILNSKASVASNESQVIQAERTIQTREETLKRILNMSKKPFSIVPTDKPEIKPMETDFNTFLAEALENRSDMKQAKANLESNNLTVRFRKNQLLPNLQLSASVISYGQAGTIWDTTTDNPFDPDFERFIIFERSFKDAVKDLFAFENNYYAIGMSLQIPIPFTREKSELAQAKVNKNRSLMQLKGVENTVYSEVKDVIKQLESNRKLVDADKIAMELESENLKAEERKLSVGLSTNFEVLTYQERLAAAQTSLLRSTIDYMLTLARINQVLNRTFKFYDIKFSEYVD